MPQKMDNNPVRAGGKNAPPYIYRRFYPQPFGDGDFAVVAVGIEEIMPPGVVDRPQGTGDRLLMFYPA
ncbi:MAG: hypothetical protein J6333_07945, partial [Planctomycetes bacterium]|nr:hypothetical protein [Planctomycetota bacterium]